MPRTLHWPQRTEIRVQNKLIHSTQKFHFWQEDNSFFFVFRGNSQISQSWTSVAARYGCVDVHLTIWWRIKGWLETEAGFVADDVSHGSWVLLVASSSQDKTFKFAYCTIHSWVRTHNTIKNDYFIFSIFKFRRARSPFCCRVEKKMSEMGLKNTIFC